MSRCFACFGVSEENKRRKQEQDHLASQEVRAKAAEAAMRRHEQFEKSAAGRATRKQKLAEGNAKKSTTPNRGEPVLKWQMG